jgi:hypothetical protein
MPSVNDYFSMRNGLCAGMPSTTIAIIVQACLHSIGYPITRRWLD